MTRTGPDETPERPLRLFVAVVPPPEAVAPLERAVRRLRATAGPELRWMLVEQWHVTLAFLGAVAPGAVDDLVAELRRGVTRTEPPRLRVRGGGAFPRPARARVLWAGIDGDVDALGDLAERCRDAARAAGIATDEKRFRAHVTLARVRRGIADVSAHVEDLAATTGPDWVVDEARLVRSRLGAGEGGRSAHDTLAALPLGAGPHDDRS